MQIIENSRGGSWTDASQWRLSPEPTLEVGRSDGPEAYQFVRIASALRRADGGIAVADAGQNEIRLYDGRGTFVRAIGGKGQGPGEFEQMGSAFQLLAGDSMVAYDIQLRRFSIFGSDGTLGRTMTFEWSPTGGFPRPVGILGDGSVLVSVGRVVAQGEAKSGLTREPTTYLRTTLAGTVLDTVATVPGGEQYVATDGGGLTVTPPLFARHPVQAVRGDRIVLGTNDAYEVGVYTTDGALRRVIRRSRPSRPVTDSEWDALASKNLEEMDPEWRGDLETMYRKMPRPPAMPYYSAALLDDGGNLWLENFRAPSDSAATWTVFDPRGRMLGEMTFPTRFRPTHIGEDFVLGVMKDDSDVESVRQFRLGKGGRGG